MVIHLTRLLNNKKEILIFWIWITLSTAVLASATGMRPYTIDLPQHVLHFALPEEMAREMAPTQVMAQFRGNDSAFLKDDFRVLAFHLYDFNGPFWVGANGSLKFSATMIKGSAEFHGDIGTLSGLDQHVRWWAQQLTSINFAYTKEVIGGKTWIARLQNTFNSPITPEEPNAVDLIVYSLPLDKEMFLEIGFRMTEWAPGRAKKWKAKAEGYREAIKATVVLEQKPK